MLRLYCLLQVIRTPETSDETYNKLVEWGKAIGKVTITCKDTPGFVVNRLLVPLMAEAVRMMERGESQKCQIYLPPVNCFNRLTQTGIFTIRHYIFIVILHKGPLRIFVNPLQKS
jgi:3-hydroxyacyl-CoA dehydrogenase